ncbi:hypothetical protein [Paraflavitalea pollutisoli]|uniref:hypothetical protein n=1 Tax=Paraflavitalea pollutisoli TaxID=3034143 RepID=UPI0023EDD855|nr:hypothetical protein [Paraflavitalea sp. H1-2-19X]
MNPIGGYYELELAPGPHRYHDTPYAFKSGRSSLHYILQLMKPSLVYVPFYTCDGLLDSFEAAGTTYQFYEINHLLEPDDLPELEANEYFLYINYFDVKRTYVRHLSAKYGDRLIVDCTQAFFMKGNGKSWFFNSCRKYFGVPDGSYLYAPTHMDLQPVMEKNEQYTVSHLIDRFNNHVREGYTSFLENEVLCGADLYGMSKLSEYLLSHINYAQVMEKRYSNYRYLDALFTEYHLFPPDEGDDCVPMVYPLLTNKPPDRKLFADLGLFIPTYWADVNNRRKTGFEIEKLLTALLLPLPIDHRYSLADMERMVKLIKRLQ